MPIQVQAPGLSSHKAFRTPAVSLRPALPAVNIYTAFNFNAGKCCGCIAGHQPFSVFVSFLFSRFARAKLKKINALLQNEPIGTNWCCQTYLSLISTVWYNFIFPPSETWSPQPNKAWPNKERSHSKYIGCVLSITVRVAPAPGKISPCSQRTIALPVLHGFRLPSLPLATCVLITHVFKLLAVSVRRSLQTWCKFCPVACSHCAHFNNSLITNTSQWAAPTHSPPWHTAKHHRISRLQTFLFVCNWLLYDYIIFSFVN